MQWLLFNKLTFLHDCSNLDLHGPQLRPVHKELVATTKLGVQQPQLKKKKKKKKKKRRSFFFVRLEK